MDEDEGDTREHTPESGREGPTRSPDPHARLVPLNSVRLATDILKRVAAELGLPGNASRADTLPMIEGKLREDGYEPRNVQVKLVEEEDMLRAIELVNEEGSFLQVEFEPEDEPLAATEGGAAADRGTDRRLEDVEDELREALAKNEERSWSVNR